jgi:hypothetical protein
MLGAAAFIIIAGGFMIYIEGLKPINLEECEQHTLERMALYQEFAGRIEPFPKGAEVTIEAFKKRIQSAMLEAAKVLEANLEVSRQSGHKRQTDAAMRRRISNLLKAAHFRDGWGETFIFKLEGADTIRVQTSQPLPAGNEGRGVIRLRGAGP